MLVRDHALIIKSFLNCINIIPDHWKYFDSTFFVNWSTFYQLRIFTKGCCQYYLLMFLNTDFLQNNKVGLQYLQNNKVGLQYLQNHTFKSMPIVFIGSIWSAKFLVPGFGHIKKLLISYFLKSCLGTTPPKVWTISTQC